MDNEKGKFRGRLIGAEQITPSLRENYDKEVRSMLEKKLNPMQRASNFFALIMSVAFVGFFIYRLAFMDIPPIAKIGTGIGLLFSTGWIVLTIKILRRGSMNARTDSNAMAGLTWGFVVLLIVLFMFTAGRMGDQVRGISLVMNGLVFFIGGATFLLANNINQEELRTRESLLKIKYQIVDLAEHRVKTVPCADAPEQPESRGSQDNHPDAKMHDTKLSGPRKWGIIALIPVLLAQVAFFGYALIIAGWELPALAKAGFGLALLFALACTAFLARILFKGSYNIKTDTNLFTAVFWVFLVFMITIIMMLAGNLDDPLKGIAMVLNGIVFFLFGVVFFLQNAVRQANLRTREKLREIENQLSDLNSKLAR
ncbi:MAG: hypothetical protein ACYC9O_13530 [Candidatus Latescibacterota bacterium]